MYRLTAESHKASQTMLSNTQNNYIHLPNKLVKYSIFHVTLVRAYLSYTIFFLPADSVPEPRCDP